MSYLPQQDVVMPGTESTLMHTLTFGSLAFMSADTFQTTIHIGEWVSEYSLWIKWHHSGMLTTTSMTDIVNLDCEYFRSVADAKLEANTISYVWQLVRARRDKSGNSH